MSDVTVRPMRAVDVPRVLELWSALMRNGQRRDPRWQPTADAHAKMSLWAPDMWLLDRPFPSGWVAEAGGQVVGWLEGRPSHVSPMLDLPPSATVGNLWVDEGWRRRGIATLLVQTFARAAAEAGYEALEVGTLAMDADAVAFWERLGFEPFRVTLRRSMLP